MGKLQMLLATKCMCICMMFIFTIVVEGAEHFILTVPTINAV